jgi:pimeloyl-ACP methyl ester carboxylesterase
VLITPLQHHDGFEYSPGLRNCITQSQPGGLFRDAVPGRFGWGTLMLVGTRRAEAQQVLFPLLAGEEVVGLPADVEAVRRAYDAPFAGLGEEGITGPRQFPLCIPLVDPERGRAAAQAEHFVAVNRTALPVHFVWGLLDDVFPESWGRSWHARIPHATWDAFDDAGHFLQDTHGRRIAELVLGYAG